MGAGLRGEAAGWGRSPAIELAARPRTLQPLGWLTCDGQSQQNGNCAEAHGRSEASVLGVLGWVEALRRQEETLDKDAKAGRGQRKTRKDCTDARGGAYFSPSGARLAAASLGHIQLSFVFPHPGAVLA